LKLKQKKEKEQEQEQEQAKEGKFRQYLKMQTKQKVVCLSYCYEAFFFLVWNLN